MTKDKLQIINELIQSEWLCALATSDGHKPHVSLMNYFVDHAAMKFYFLSPKNSLKNKNLKKCPHVSMLIDQRDKNLALTIGGVYSPIKRVQTSEAITRLFVLRHPHLEEFAKRSDTILIRIEAREGWLSSGLAEQFTTKFKNS